MEMIIGRSHTPLNSSRTIGSVRRRDDNSRGKVQNVRGDSSDEGQGDRLFTSGDHVLEVRLYDGVQPDPVVTRTFHCRIEPQQVTDIYNRGNETAEFTIPPSFTK
jgi:hypothetical protein